MNQYLGKKQPQEPYHEALETLISTFAQHQGFFAVRLPDVHARLRYLVRCSCRHLHAGDPARAQPILQEELFRLFGVQVVVPAQRQLSLLAGVIRHVLVSYVRMQRQSAARGGVTLLVDELRAQLPAKTQHQPIDVLAVDSALNELRIHDPGSSCLLELRYFARLALRYLALETNAPLLEVQRDMRFAKAWLVQHLQNPRVRRC